MFLSFTQSTLVCEAVKTSGHYIIYETFSKLPFELMSENCPYQVIEEEEEKEE